MDYEKFLKEEWIMNKKLYFSEEDFKVDDNFKLLAENEFKEGWCSDDWHLIEHHMIFPNLQRHYQGKSTDVYVYVYGEISVEKEENLTYEDERWDSTLRCPYKVYETTYVNSEELDEFHELFLDTMKFTNFTKTDDTKTVSALVDEQRLKNKENPVLPMSLWIALNYVDLGGFVEEKIHKGSKQLSYAERIELLK